MIGELPFTYKSDANEQRGYYCSSVKSRYYFYYLISMYFDFFFQKHLELRRCVLIYNKSK